jgi:carbonic anhydrase
VEQVVNVCQSTVLQDAWSRGQVIQVHGWVYGIHDGLLQDLRISVSGLDDLEAIYKQAVEGVLACSRNA